MALFCDLPLLFMVAQGLFKQRVSGAEYKAGFSIATLLLKKRDYKTSRSADSGDYSRQ
ncbi:hypothetical protein L3i22_022570 [Actinoplanes sp. L3-i22]|nr:hypothetical protein L3i22_022570 [Actinoplanes sp. L3-i22]